MEIYFSVLFHLAPKDSRRCFERNMTINLSSSFNSAAYHQTDPLQKSWISRVMESAVNVHSPVNEMSEWMSEWDVIKT